MISAKGFELPDLPFQSDGCSGGFSAIWKKVTGQAPAFESCCFDHDVEYHYGSGPTATAAERFRERGEADLALFRCVRAHPRGGLFWASLMYAGVRIGGGAYWPTTYRWGFGWE